MSAACTRWEGDASLEASGDGRKRTSASVSPPSPNWGGGHLAFPGAHALWGVCAGCSVKRDLSTASAHLVLNFRDAPPPSPRGSLANATPRRFPLRLITRNLSSGM